MGVQDLIRDGYEVAPWVVRELAKDAERYQWLKSRRGLSLHTDGSTWTREDGTKFTNTHSLAEGDTRHSSGESLDEIIDNAMKLSK